MAVGWRRMPRSSRAFGASPRSSVATVAGDFVLHGEHVGRREIELLRPLVKAGGNVDELHGDAQAVAGLAYAAFEHAADAELLSDLAQVVIAAELERGRACRHPQPLDMRERVDEFLGQAFAQVVLVALRTHVGEGQYRYCLGFGPWLLRRSLRPLPGRRRARYRRGESVAQPVPGFDVDGLLRVVAQRLAQFLHAGDERVVTHHRAAPYAGEQFLLGNRRARAFQQRRQHQRGLAREPDFRVVFPEPRTRGLEAETAECDLWLHAIPVKSRRCPGTPGPGCP